MKCETHYLGDVCTFIDYRGKTPPKTTSGIPLVTAKIVKNGMIQEPQEFIAENYYDEWMRRGIPKKGSVVFTTEAPLGEVARIRTDDKLAFAQRIIILEPKIKQLSADYLFYALQDRVLKSKIEARSTGTTVIGIKAAELKKVEIDLPSLEEQEKIAAILCSLDDKIEVNNKINENLQKQAQALYKDMFIDNPNVETTKGVLSDIAEITMGQSPSGSSYNECGNGEVFYQGRAEFGFRFPTRRLFTTQPKRMAETDDVLLSVRAPVGDLNVAYEQCCVGRGLSAIHSKDGNNSFLLYTMFALKPKLDVFNGEGTVFGSINKNGLSDLPVDIPCAGEIAKFEAAVRPMDDLIRSNYEENCRLQVLRDSFLPKLMSGEMDVEDVKI